MRSTDYILKSDVFNIYVVSSIHADVTQRVGNSQFRFFSGMRQALASAMLVNRTVVFIDLSGNQIGDLGAKAGRSGRSGARCCAVLLDLIDGIDGFRMFQDVLDHLWGANPKSSKFIQNHSSPSACGAGGLGKSFAREQHHQADQSEEQQDRPQGSQGQTHDDP